MAFTSLFVSGIIGQENNPPERKKETGIIWSYINAIVTVSVIKKAGSFRNVLFLKINQSGVCLPSLKKEPAGHSLSCQILGCAGNKKNLIGLFRRLETKKSLKI